MANEEKFTLTKAQKRKLIRLAFIALIALTVWFYTQAQDVESPAPEDIPNSDTQVSESATEVLGILNSLTVAEKLEDGYDRAAFGSAWKDVDKNGCDTRNDILARDLTNLIYEDDCVVLEGEIVDPYTLEAIHFVKGHGSLVDIDHVVALGEAAASGAMSLSETQKEAIANDPENLLAVDAGANRAKGDKDASEWLPPNEDFHCEYVTMQVLVKDKYDLSVSMNEKDVMARVLENC